MANKKYASLLGFIDWAEKYPHENSYQTAVRQSTICMCGKSKDIGQNSCGGHAAEYFNPEQGGVVAWQ